MNRRDFLKSALTIAALAPMEKVFSATETVAMVKYSGCYF